MNNSCLIVGCLKENLNFNVVHVLNLFSLWVEKSLLFASFLKQLACFKFNVWILILVIEWCGKVQMNTKWWKAMTSSLGHKLLVILWFHQAHDFTIVENMNYKIFYIVENILTLFHVCFLTLSCHIFECWSSSRL